MRDVILLMDALVRRRGVLIAEVAPSVGVRAPLVQSHPTGCWEVVGRGRVWDHGLWVQEGGAEG